MRLFKRKTKFVIRCVLLIFLFSSFSGFSQDTVTFNDGEFYLEGEQITVNEFNVLLEKQGLMTPFRKRLMDVSQDRIWNEQQIRRTYQIMAGTWYCYGLLWLSQEPWADAWADGVYGAFAAGTISFGMSYIDVKKRSYRVYFKIVEEYNCSLLEHSTEATTE